MRQIALNGSLIARDEHLRHMRPRTFLAVASRLLPLRAATESAGDARAQVIAPI